MHSMKPFERAAMNITTSAFTKLIEANQGMLYRVCRTILRDEADCADAVQEAILAAWLCIGQLRSVESFPAWVARICIHRCYRITRSHRRVEIQDEPETRDARDTRLDVVSAVDGLPEKLRLPVVFHYFEDWSMEDTARALGIFQGTVKSRLHRARQLLAVSLNDYKEGISDNAQ
jgi:RNA polymerase sigma-70 factor (ECF subfamily)